MNRVIKFRVWDKEKKHFVKTFVENFVNPIISPQYELNQFTGLFDKNDKEIYEGDILRTKNYGNTPPQIWEVVWSPDNSHFTGFGYKARNGIVNSLSHAFTVSRDMEVIGNIYENSELLR